MLQMGAIPQRPADARVSLGLRPANERRRNIITTSPIGWVQV